MEKKDEEEKDKENEDVYDFMALLYKNIGARIRMLRKEAGLNQQGIFGVDTSILSNIENGKAKDKNKKFINATQLNVICEKFHKTPSEIIWGTDEEKVSFVKMLVVAALLNNPENPFTSDDVSSWIDVYWGKGAYESKRQHENISDAENNYGFFVNRENYMRYELLGSYTDIRFERVSNLILKQLLHNYDFSIKFISRLINISKHESTGDSPTKSLIIEYLANRGNYCDLILDKQGIDYHRFILAFNCFWKRAAKQYMEYFEEKLFIDNDTLREKSIYDLNNESFRTVLTSESFAWLNEEMTTRAEYLDGESYVANLNTHFELVRAHHVDLFSKGKPDHSMTRFIAKIKTAIAEQTEIFFLQEKPPSYDEDELRYIVLELLSKLRSVVEGREEKFAEWSKLSAMAMELLNDSTTT